MPFAVKQTFRCRDGRRLVVVNQSQLSKLLAQLLNLDY